MNRNLKLLTVLAVLAAQLATAAAASAATEVGQLQPPYKWSGCGGTLIVETAIAPGGLSYTVPKDGVITSWSTATVASAGSAKLKVVRPTGVAGEYRIVGEDGPRSVPANSTPTYGGVRIPVQAGDSIGLLASGTNCSAWTQSSLYQYSAFEPGTDPALGTTASITVVGSEWAVDVRALVEPDADGDGYGDETQDACPADPGAHDIPCPPPGEAAGPRPPRLSLHGRAVQAALKQGGIVELVGSDQAAALRATGSLAVAGSKQRLPLGTTSGGATAGGRTRLVLHFTAKAKRRVAAALRHGRRVRARISVEASAGATAASAAQQIVIEQAKKRGK
jgi:hypothetical protein